MSSSDWDTADLGYEVLGLDLGEAHEIRNAGGVAT